MLLGKRDKKRPNQNKSGRASRRKEIKQKHGLRCGLRDKKRPNPKQIGFGVTLAAELGFEPRQTESESAVLPLHNSASMNAYLKA